MKRVISMVVASLSVAAATVGQSPDRPLAQQGYAGLTLRDIPDGHTVISWIFPGPLQGEGLVAPKFDLARPVQRIQRPTPTESSPWASLLYFAPGAARGTLGTVAENEFSSQDALKALERFVVENDELLALEERIGRFNIFDALGIARIEIRHSNFLAWLLDPAESHGQGALFLKAILMDLLAQTPPEMRPFSPVQLDGAELRGVEIRREWRNIDILITCEEPKFVIAIENKIGSGERRKQLSRYETVLNEAFGNVPKQFVYLTIEGDEPSEEKWVPYTYGDIHRILTRVRKTNATAIGEDVLAFLDHYLRLIGSQLMDDPKIDELCQRIYRNHRQAIDLLVKRIGPGNGLLQALRKMLENQGNRWHIFNVTSRRIDFVPRSWLAWLPPWSARPKQDPQAWFRWEIYVTERKCRVWIVVGRCQDLELRRQVLKQLTQPSEKFDLRIAGKQTDRYSRVYSRTCDEWPEGEDPEVESVTAKVQKRLDEAERRLRGVPEALRPILQGHTTPPGKP